MSEGALFNRLPKRVDPRKMSHAFSELAGIVPEVELPRLLEASATLEGSSGAAGANRVMVAKLKFSVDDQRRKLVTGLVQMDVVLECQRCLGPLATQISTDVHLAVCWDEEEAAKLPKSLDPWIVGEDDGDLHAILEEELLLALPTVALHDYSCAEASTEFAGEETQVAKESEEPNPFGVLAGLKQQLKKTTDG